MGNKKEKSILIISTNAIGDSYLSLSAAESIYHNFPDAKLYFLINGKSVILTPVIDAENIFILRSRNVLNVLKSIFEIRRTEFDYAFTFFPGRLNSLLLSLSKAKIKAGYLNFKKIENWFSQSQMVYTNFKTKNVEEWKPELNFLDRIKLVLKAAGFNSDAVQKNRLKTINFSISKNDQILIHPFSMIKSKSLSVTQLFALIDLFKKKFGKQIILIGSDELITGSDLFLQLVDIGVTIRLNQSLTDLVSLISTSYIFSAVDSFPIHIADSMNSQFLGIFGPTCPSSVLIHSEKSVFFDVGNLQQVDEKKLTQEVEKYLCNSGFE